jgi:hypothetical protein
MPKYHYYSLYQEFKVPFNEDGTMGDPICTKKFSKQLNKSDSTTKLKKETKKLVTKKSETVQL